MKFTVMKPIANQNPLLTVPIVLYATLSALIVSVVLIFTAYVVIALIAALSIIATIAKIKMTPNIISSCSNEDLLFLEYFGDPANGFRDGFERRVFVFLSGLFSGVLANPAVPRLIPGAAFAVVSVAAAAENAVVAAAAASYAGVVAAAAENAVVVAEVGGGGGGGGAGGFSHPRHFPDRFRHRFEGGFFPLEVGFV